MISATAGWTVSRSLGFGWPRSSGRPAATQAVEVGVQYRPIGGGALEVSGIGLGCMTMTGDYGAGEEAEAIATIHRAIALGVNFLDTADAYGRGRNEALLGRALKGRCDAVVLATKFGPVRDADGRPAIDGRPEYVAQACDASLERLGTDVIDLYYLHRVDRATPIEDTVGAMARLVEQGKVRCLGLSEAAPATLRRASAVHPIAALQSELSLWTRDAEAEVLPTCAELGVSFIAYSPLGRGFLTGAVTGAGDLGADDRRATMPRFEADNLGKNLELLRPIEAMAAAKGCTPAQVALAWVLGGDERVIPIPGAKSRRHLEDNAGALDVALDAAEREALSRAFPLGAAAGARFDARQMRQINL